MFITMNFYKYGYYVFLLLGIDKFCDVFFFALRKFSHTYINPVQ